ncbi:hypothetical protein RQP46_008348 [Phenoliferia psychrophenolica]
MSNNSSSSVATSASFHFSPPTLATTLTSPLHSPISPLDPTHELDLEQHSPPLSSHSPHHPFDSDLATPLFSTTTTSASPRPQLAGRSNSYAHHNNQQSQYALADDDAAAIERQRRVSYAGPSFFAASTTLPTREDDALASTAAGIWGVSAGASGRTARAASEDQLLARTGTARTFGSGSSAGGGGDASEPANADRFASQPPRPPFLPPPSAFSSLQSLPLNSPPLSSPPPLAPHMGILQAQAQEAHQQAQAQANDPRASPSLHMGDLDVWMDEAYVRECCARMGWDGVSSVKMIRGTSPSSGYCFLTFPSANHAAQVLARFNASPPTLMPRSSRTFKLNWGTGIPGVLPRWEGEYSVFVGDLGREVGESELVSLFTPLFPSTKSAKILYDPSTSLSRGYGFVRFADESDMLRALVLGQNAGSGLSLHGRTLRISEASGPGNDAAGRERTRSSSRDGSVAVLPPANVNANGNGAQMFSPYQPQQQHQQQPHDLASPASPYVDYLSPTFPVPYTPLSPTGSQFAQNPLSPTLANRNGPLSPGFANQNPLGGSVGPGAGGAHQSAATAPPHTTDPNNTTVFVGGLPACISEETLKSFFHHFGEITYCKIPTGKGCGFVQFVRRADAETAISKMNDFPIHGKSRIRLSWGRSQGDKQVEHVRKLASALGVPFEAVWRMVQGQDTTTIKQIVTAVGGTTPVGSRFDNLAGDDLEFGAVASAAGLTEAELLNLVSRRGPDAFSPNGSLNGHANGGNAGSRGGESSDFFARSSGASGGSQHDQSNGNGNGNGGPYSRVSPSTFSAFGSAPSSLPLSPPPSGSRGGHQLQYQQQQAIQHPHPHQGYAPPSPYTSIRPESYLVNAPPSPYERVDFAAGGVPQGAQQQPRFPQQHQQGNFNPYPPRYNNHPQQIYQPGGFQPGGFQQGPPPPHQYESHDASAYGGPQPGLDESLSNMRLHSTPGPPSQAPLPPRNGGFQQQPFFGDKFIDDSRSRSYLAQGALAHGGGGAHWGGAQWQGERDVQA